MGSNTLRTYSGRGSGLCWSGDIASIPSDPPISALQSSSSVSLDCNAPIARVEEEQVDSQNSNGYHLSVLHPSTSFTTGGNKNYSPPSHSTSTALELTETGKSRKVLDSLAYPLDGSGSRSIDAALNSSLTFVRELKFKEKRKVARQAGLGAEVASKILSATDNGRESIVLVLSVGLYLLCKEDADIVGPAPVKALCNLICQKPARSTSVSRDSRASKDSSPSAVTAAASGPARRPSKLRMRTKSKQPQQGCQAVDSTYDMMGDSGSEKGPITDALSLLGHSEILKWGITGGRQSVVQSDIALHTLICLAASDTTGEIREAIRVEGGLSEATKKICEWKMASASSHSSCEDNVTEGGGYLRRLLSWLHFMELATHSCPASASYVTSEVGGKELLRCLANMVATGRANSSYETSLTEEFLPSVLRVLVNLTHHNPTACQTLTGVGGLFKLMRCFIAEGPSQPVILRRLKATNPNFYFVFDESEKCQGQTALMMETIASISVRVALVEDCLENGLHMARGRKGHDELREGGHPSFDVHVLALTVLTNCVELHSRFSLPIFSNLPVENRSLIAAMRICEQCPLNLSPSLILDTNTSSEIVPTPHSGVVSAIEFLSGCFLRKMKGFETHLLPESDGPLTESRTTTPLKYLQQQKEKEMEEENSNKKYESPSLTTTNLTESEDCMSPSDVEDLILAGHLGMLLGCLAVGGKKEEVSAALDPSTHLLDRLVRVLHAFLSLHQHAEVLSTDIAVPILTLIRNLEADDKKEEECYSQGLRASQDVKSGATTIPITAKRVKKGDSEGVMEFEMPDEYESTTKRARSNVF